METKKDEKKSTTSQVANIDKNLADMVLNKVRIFTANKDLRLPPDYSPENALKSAWLILLETKDSNKRPVLEVCTRESIANSLLKMILLGLNPIKGQCDFIAYGAKLSCDVNYFGTLALAKRHGGVEDVIPIIVYENDVFEYEIINGIKKVTKHVQAFENIDVNKIKGAYATVYFQDSKKEPYVEIMTIQQIRQSWQQGAMKGNSPAHNNFPDQMSGKTAISRACKLFINSSDDSDLEEDNRTAAARQQANDNANKEEVTMDTDAEEVVDNDKTDDTPENNTSKAPGSEAEEKVTNEPEKAEASKIPGF